MTESRPSIALVAHDHRKEELIAWARAHAETLARFDLVATGTTGKVLHEALGLPVRRLQSGPLGGDLSSARWSPSSRSSSWSSSGTSRAQPHDPDVRALLRVAVVWNVPVACNRSTADLLLASPLVDGRGYERALPAYEAHLGRAVPGAEE